MTRFELIIPFNRHSLDGPHHIRQSAALLASLRESEYHTEKLARNIICHLSYTSLIRSLFYTHEVSIIAIAGSDSHPYYCSKWQFCGASTYFMSSFANFCIDG